MRVVPVPTTSSSQISGSSGISLPPELVSQAVVRMCIIAIMSCISTLLFYGVHGLLQPEVAEVQQLASVRLSALAVVLYSLGLFGLQQSGWFSQQGVLHLGTIYQVLVAFSIAMIETATPYDPNDVVRGLSSVALWTTLCGLLVPSTPWVNLGASLASASMWPLAFYVNMHMLHHPWIGWSRFGAWTFPLVMCVFWTNLLSRRLYRMQMAAHRAEEMGSYKLDYLIGQGGMGEVWRARHRLLARDAAVKVIRPEILARHSIRDASMVRKRFEKEAQATASLRSPHTVALYDFGVARDESFYYVMELLDGIDLQTLVKNFGPLPAGRVRNILVQACESLEEAHRLGMVHRDIKPRNIFLCKLGLQFDHVKVLDFGLVKNIDSPEEATQMSADGTATGTPAYMAPEIATGERKIDGRADIYALGCVAYFLLTGELVFDEPNAMAAALAHVQKTPIPPSERTEMPIPAGLERIVMQCLEKDPAKRPQSAWDLARKLEALTDVPRFCRDSAERWWTTHLPVVPVAAVGAGSNPTSTAGSPVVAAAGENLFRR